MSESTETVSIRPDITTSILHRLSDGLFHSGQVLADELQVSRTAIWKIIHALQKPGLAIDVIPHRGYRIPNGFEFLDQQRILSHLDAPIRLATKRIDIFSSLPSTNQYLLEHLSFPSGSVCLTEQQTQGRGRMGRTWFSPMGGNIYSSLLWHFDSNLAALSGLSIAIGIACVHALQQYGLTDVQIKWPNDLVVHGRKLGGILLEIAGAMQSNCAVVIGIGLNIKLPTEAENAITQPYSDLETIFGRAVSRNQLIALLLTAIIPLLQTFNVNGLTHYLTHFQALDYLYQKPIIVNTPHGKYEGEGFGIDSVGNLRVRLPDQSCLLFNSAEVQVRTCR